MTVCTTCSSEVNCRTENSFRTAIDGDFASAAIATAYYPPSDRGAGRVFGTALINTGERALANLVQEFVLRRLTPKAQNEK
jgi:hypothetical protein